MTLSDDDRQKPPAESAISAERATLNHDIRTAMNGILGMAELLLMADDIDERHRRRIEVIQRSGRTLLALLDRAPDPAKTQAAAEKTEARPPPSDASPALEHSEETSTVWDILVAEDDPDMALLIEDLIEEAGHRPTVASDGGSALRMLDERPFDLVLMDGRMPDMTGFETAERIRRLPDERARIPIVALTGEALDGDRERFLAAGMDDYIAKPIDYDILVTTIDRCCGQRD